MSSFLNDEKKSTESFCTFLRGAKDYLRIFKSRATGVSFLSKGDAVRDDLRKAKVVFLCSWLSAKRLVVNE